MIFTWFHIGGLRCTFMQVRLTYMTGTGDLIRAARERAGYTQAELADALGVSRNTILNWEKHDLPPRNKLGKLQDVLKLDDRLHPRGAPDTQDPRRMSNSELIARLNSLVSQLNALTVEVTQRLSPEDTGPSQRRAPLHADESPGAVFFNPGDATDEPDSTDADNPHPSRRSH
jgi:DNA-binding XRE family transcriptional regulator